jgi:single-strand DNA-binding protein
MAGETLVTVAGNLTADPELRHTAAGIPVTGFTVASTPRVFDRELNEFVDGEPLFLRCSIWRQAAENAAQSVARGMRVIVTGRLKQRTFDDKEGQRRTVAEIDAEEIAVSLTYAHRGRHQDLPRRFDPNRRPGTGNTPRFWEHRAGSRSGAC